VALRAALNKRCAVRGFRAAYVAAFAFAFFFTQADDALRPARRVSTSKCIYSLSWFAVCRRQYTSWTFRLHIFFGLLSWALLFSRNSPLTTCLSACQRYLAAALTLNLHQTGMLLRRWARA